MSAVRGDLKRYLDFPRSEYETRYSKLQSLMVQQGIDALLITTSQNARYFTGLKTLLFRGRLRPITALLLATREPVMIVPEVLEGTCLATTWVEDFRLSSECYGKPPIHMVDLISDTIRDLGLSDGTLGMEFGIAHHLGMTQQELEALREKIPRAKWVNASDLIWELRSVKSSCEVEALKTACDISAVGVEAGFKALKPGLTERELYGVIASTYYKEGAEDHMLVLHSGAKGYQVRDAIASDYPFERGHFMKVDGGAVYKGYYCDFCRILAVGPLLDSQRRAIETSALANAAAIKQMRPGGQIKDAGAAGDRVIKGRGLSFYMNAYGHNVGLDLHEPPWLDRVSTAPVKEGMVLSVEFGVIDADRPDDGSYTFEDNLVVTKNGPRVLTDRIPAELLEVS
jgi:Xaa-Pro aminopeptidase